jgi:hypothetical protein
MELIKRKSRKLYQYNPQIIIEAIKESKNCRLSLLPSKIQIYSFCYKSMNFITLRLRLSMMISYFVMPMKATLKVLDKVPFYSKVTIIEDKLEYIVEVHLTIEWKKIFLNSSF